MEMTQFKCGDFVWMEPVTMLTDLLVTLVCWWGFVSLHKHKNVSHPVVKWYRLFLVSMGLATAYGGVVGHGLQYYLPFEWKVPGWYISMLSVAFAERGAIMHARPLMPRKLGDFLAVFNVFELLVFMCIAAISLKFLYVEIHAVYGMLVVVFSFESFIYAKTRDQGSRQLMLAVGAASAAMVVHLSKLSFHRFFNYLDLSHVLMALSMIFIIRGVKRFSM